MNPIHQIADFVEFKGVLGGCVFHIPYHLLKIRAAFDASCQRIDIILVTSNQTFYLSLAKNFEEVEN